MFTVRNAYSKMLQFVATFLAGLSIGIALVKLLCLFNIINLNSKQYVYVDIEKVIVSVNGILKQQIEEEQLTEAQISDKLILAKDKFNLLLNSYVKDHNAVVFSSTKVIAGAEDITKYFTDEILVGIK